MTGEAAGSNGRFDWQRARERLAELAEALERQERGLSPEQSARVLEERAQLLARRTRALAAQSADDVVRFTLAPEVYALSTRWVHAVVRAPQLPVPAGPPALRGLALVGGEVLPVVSLRPLLGRPAAAEPGPLLLVGGARAELALATDSVEGVEALAAGALQPLPGGEEGWVLGVTAQGLAVLEGERLLQDARLTFDFGDGGGRAP